MRVLFCCQRLRHQLMTLPIVLIKETSTHALMCKDKIGGPEIRFCARTLAWKAPGSGFIFTTSSKGNVRSKEKLKGRVCQPQAHR